MRKSERARESERKRVRERKRDKKIKESSNFCCLSKCSHYHATFSVKIIEVRFVCQIITDLEDGLDSSDDRV